MKLTKEACYAIRIGDPKYCSSYFMIGDDDRAPRLFATEGEALKEVEGGGEWARQNEWKAVKVELRELK